MDKSRQQFEAWVADNAYLFMHINLTYHEAALYKLWQASRDSLINSLEPAGYIDNAESIDLEHGRVCYLYKDNIDKINIPIYRLDKQPCK